MNHILARETGDGIARPSDVLSFDDRHVFALRGQCPCEVFARLPAAEDHQIVFVEVQHVLSL